VAEQLADSQEGLSFMHLKLTILLLLFAAKHISLFILFLAQMKERTHFFRMFRTGQHDLQGFQKLKNLGHRCFIAQCLLHAPLSSIQRTLNFAHRVYEQVPYDPQKEKSSSFCQQPSVGSDMKPTI
jgi:hypothetical protein